MRMKALFIVRLRGLDVKRTKYTYGGGPCDSSRSAIAGPYYMEDSEKTGVWQVNLTDYKAERISHEFYREMCILQGELYGVEKTLLQELQLLQIFRIKKLRLIAG